MSKEITYRLCLYCNNKYTVKVNSQKYCSISCSNRYNNQLIKKEDERERIEIIRKILKIDPLY